MPFSFRDDRMKATVFFTTIERKNRYIERMAKKPDHAPLKKGGRTSRQTTTNT
jgi:hypothetical protein